MQLLVVQIHGLYCPACRMTFNKEFADAYPEIATYHHNKEHSSFGLDTPESYNEDIVKWSYPQEIYHLSTELSTD